MTTRNQYLQKMANEVVGQLKKAPPAANDIVDMRSFGGHLGDLLSPGNWGGERAGRTQAMADAIDEPTTFGVRHPRSQSLMHLGAGGILGAGLGAGVTALSGWEPPDVQNSALVGGGLGSLAGILASAMSRRKEMQRVNDLYDEGLPEGKVKPKNPELSRLSAALLPGRGPHRTGQIEAVRAMKGNGSIASQHGGMRDGLYAVGRTVPATGALHGWAQNIKTQLADTDEDVTPQNRKKAKPAANPAAKRQPLRKAAIVNDAKRQTVSERLTAPTVSRVAPGGREPAASPGMLSSLLSGAGSLMGNLKNPDGSINWSNPALPLMIGGGLGTGASLLSSATTSDEEKKKKWLRNAVLGGLLGGAGGYMGRKGYESFQDLDKLDQSEIDAANTPQELPLPEKIQAVAGSRGSAASIAGSTAAGAVIGNSMDRRNTRRADRLALAKTLTAAQSVKNKKGKPGATTPPPPHAPSYHLPDSPDINKMNDRLLVPITQAQIDQVNRNAYASWQQKAFGVPSTTPGGPRTYPYGPVNFLPAQQTELRALQGNKGTPVKPGSTPPAARTQHSNKNRTRFALGAAAISTANALNNVQPMSQVDKANAAAAAQTKANMTKTQKPIGAID